jgi:3-dehydrotetronate 4-kinase
MTGQDLAAAPGLIGCIADDYTGATDVAAGLRRVGLRTVLLFGLPADAVTVPACDAIVIGLKSRTIRAADAVQLSLQAYRWLARRGAGATYFKYCSTFDSTDQGNIGPVADALTEASGTSLTFVTPASPEHGRTVYQGHLFVGDTLLSESSMRHHPLTPMTDSNLVRVLGRQTSARVGLLPLPTILQGEKATRDAVDAARDGGVRYLVTDAVTDEHLHTLARAGADVHLHTGGAGLARHLAQAWSDRGGAPDREEGAASVDLPAGPGLALAGSCSATTLRQVGHALRHLPAHRIDPARTPDEPALRQQALQWLDAHRDSDRVLIYSSAGPQERAAAASALGERTADILEGILADVARAAVTMGRRRLVVAGGETSGAVVEALGVRSVLVQAEEDHGVPWCVTTTEPRLALLLKSGNFGAPDLLVRGLEGART